ncbi:flagellar hook assembly protein FlgD [Frigoribacterium faeni]|uniref:flagellar hook assembly protein FlgD n=1 Tax=Frigoribacterium faeni TaxID=145483 RepID=UPI00141B6C4D|nr:flagellar hook capping FlgD N-terminal domain-containing protein [Frigoribacterium faeni]NIJ05336.1 flagellar basal-body rod modification protein FlgD [Frigoribacterium faeni]
MPSIDQISGTVDPAVMAAAQQSSAGRTTKSSMDSEMFMNLLVTQLKNQDPSSPMDTNQMMSQTTQLSMMEQITNQTTTANEGFSLQMRTSASALVGREVSYTGPDGKAVTGTATSVSFAESVPKVTVGGKEVALDLISGISATPTA